MSMMESLRLADLAAQERERQQQARQAVQEGQRITFEALQTLPAVLVRVAAKERRDAICRLLGHDPTAEAVARLAGASGGQWQGSPSALASAIGADMDATRFGGHLRKITKYLRAIGLRVTIEHKGREGRRVTIEPFDRDRFDRLVKELNG